MKMQDFRRQRLAALVKADGGPAAFCKQRSQPDADKPIDATYISQLINGHRAFGERAARSMEARAGLPSFYFDGTDVLNPVEAHLLEMFRALPQNFRAALLSDAEKYLDLATPGTQHNSLRSAAAVKLKAAANGSP